MAPEDDAYDPAVEWAPLVDPSFAEIAREVRLLAAVTPHGAERERARLVGAAKAGQPTMPQWTYARVDVSHPLRLAGDLARRMAQMPPSPVRDLYVDRLRELTLEAEMVDAVGTARFSRLAQDRFRPEATAGDATRLSEGWLEGDDGPPKTTIASDSSDPRSLLSRMRAELVRLDLRFEVVPTDQLLALAAIGDERVWIAAGRAVTVEDVERTITHELHGHALPRSRAARVRLGLFRVGTARGADDQEGMAIVLEERAGFLGARRKRELAGRHLTVNNMRDGATFADATGALLARGFSAEEAVRTAERVYRGADGRSHGLGRERVYLESFVRARKHLSRRPQDGVVVSSGQISLDAARTLLPFVGTDSSRGPTAPGSSR